MKLFIIEWFANDKNGNLIEEKTRVRVCENIANQKDVILRINLLSLISDIGKLRGLLRIGIKKYYIDGEE